MNRKKQKKSNASSGKVITIELWKIICPIIIITLVGGIILGTTTLYLYNTKTSEQEAEAGSAGSSNVTWVTSTSVNDSGETVEDTDSDGNVITVPVPEGYTASQIEGETSVTSGFVIYEGDIDWDTIVSNSASSASAASVASLETEEVEEAETTTTDTNTTGESLTSTSSTDTDTNSTVEASTDTSTEDTETTTTSDTEKIDEIEEDDEEFDENSEEINSEGSEEDDEEAINSLEEEFSSEEATTVDEISEDDSTSSEEISEEITTETSSDESDDETSTVDNGISTASVEEEDNGISVASEELTATSTMTELELQSSVNQYVWVPVSDISRIYGVDSSGKLWGKLYNYSSSSRSAYNWSESTTSNKTTLSITSATSYREPDVMLSLTAYDLDSKLEGYLDGSTKYELLSEELEQNFYLMIQSIKEYGGFYIGRYETGGLSGTAVVQRMQSGTSISSQTWYVMYEKCKGLSGDNDNVTTSMIWGCLWDETLQWLIDSGEKTNAEIYASATSSDYSSSWGNFTYTTFTYYTDTDGTTATKASGTSTKIPTGSADFTKANNIYDMAGNVYDWTLEACSTYDRVLRGGYYTNYSSTSTRACYRGSNSPTVSITSYGCRAVLYIK